MGASTFLDYRPAFPPSIGSGPQPAPTSPEIMTAAPGRGCRGQPNKSLWYLRGQRPQSGNNLHSRAHLSPDRGWKAALPSKEDQQSRKSCKKRIASKDEANQPPGQLTRGPESKIGCSE